MSHTDFETSSILDDDDGEQSSIDLIVSSRTADSNVDADDAGNANNFRVILDRRVAMELSRLAWCPAMDVLVAISTDSTLHLIRAGGSRGWSKLHSFSLPSPSNPLKQSASSSSSSPSTAAPDSVTCALWRIPDGKAIACGFANGALAIFSVEGHLIYRTHASTSHSLLHCWTPRLGLYDSDGSVSYSDRAPTFLPAIQHSQVSVKHKYGTIALLLVATARRLILIHGLAPRPASNAPACSATIGFTSQSGRVADEDLDAILSSSFNVLVSSDATSKLSLRYTVLHAVSVCGYTRLMARCTHCIAVCLAHSAWERLISMQAPHDSK
jgi:hypothetical protein